MAKDSVIVLRVEPDVKRLLKQVAERDGHNLSELLRGFAQGRIEAEKQADIEAETVIREQLGEQGMQVVRGLRLRPSDYLRAWQDSHPPKRTPEEQRTLEDDQARRMGLSPEQYQDGRRRGPRGTHDDPET